MPTLTQLEYAVAVDTHRHFGKAANACHVSQPTLSMQLIKLEEELGAALFDRSIKPILPTDLGKEIIAQARKILQDMQNLLLTSTKVTGQISGQLKIGIIPTLSSLLIPRFLPVFTQTNPLVSLQITELKTAHILEELENEKCDVGIMATPTGHANFFEHALFYEPFYFYCSQEHALANEKQISQDELGNTPLWLLKDGHCMRNQTMRVCSNTKQQSVIKNVSFESGNLETLRRLVEMSGGATLLPYLSLANAEGKIEKNAPQKGRAIAFNQPTPCREVSLVYRRRYLKENLLEALAKSILLSLPDSIKNLRKKNLEIFDVSDFQ